MRPFYEAALALFSIGAPPAIVISKFNGMVSTSTIWRWYYQWAEYKGINPNKGKIRTDGRTPRRPEYESPIAAMRKANKKLAEKELRAKYGEYYDPKFYDLDSDQIDVTPQDPGTGE
jgi:hypothetical protein